MNIKTRQRLYETVVRRKGGAVVVLSFLLIIAVSCGGANTASNPPQPVIAPPQSQPMQAPPARSSAAPQEAFLARIKNASSGNGIIRDARMNGDSELGVVLSENVKLRQVRPLMQTLLREMRDEFPNRALTVRAYAPNGQELAVMQHNPSAPRGRDTTFTPAPGLN